MDALKAGGLCAAPAPVRRQRIDPDFPDGFLHIGHYRHIGAADEQAVHENPAAEMLRGHLVEVFPQPGYVFQIRILRAEELLQKP